MTEFLLLLFSVVCLSAAFIASFPHNPSAFDRVPWFILGVLLFVLVFFIHATQALH